MNRDRCTGLGQFDPGTPEERRAWQQITTFVDTQPRAFSRDPGIGGHVTASAFLLSPDGLSVLLCHHRKLGRWLQLGGHCDDIADTRFVALKEAYEESGLARISLLREDIFDVDIYEIPARPDEPSHLHYDVRYLMRAEAGSVRVSSESLELAWVRMDEFERYSTEPSLLRMRDKAGERLTT